MKTKLVNLPANQVARQEVIAFMVAALVFKAAQEVYKANRQKEDKLDATSTKELEILRKEGKQKILTKEYNAFKDEFLAQMKEDNELLRKGLDKNTPLTEKQRNKLLGKYSSKEEELEALVQSEVQAHRVKVHYEVEDLTKEVTTYRKTHKEIAQVKVLYKSDAEMAFKMLLSLAVGIKEAAFYVAMNFLGGYGVVASEFLADLAMAIGVKLGHKGTIDLVNADSDQPLREDAKALAGKCVTQIQKNAKEVGMKTVTHQEAIGMVKALDQIVKANSKLSFLENILDSVIKGYAEFVEFDSGSTSQANGSNHHADQNTPLLAGQHQHNNVDDSCCVIL